MEKKKMKVSDYTKIQGVTLTKLDDIPAVDDTSTKGKVTSKFTIVDDTETIDSIEKVDKNKLFSVEIPDFFCPIKFDDSIITSNLRPLVESGLLSVDAMQCAIDKSKKEFFALHEKEISDANNMTFDKVLAKLQTNQTLYQKVLNVCGLNSFKESDYIIDNQVCIYRANQCTDKEGKNRYRDVSLNLVENGKTFSVNLFAEYREINTTNILLAIRYYSTKLDATKRLFNQISDYRRILTTVADIARKAKENGFTKEQILSQIDSIFD